LLDKFPKVFFALTFDVGEEKLKMKAKAPKSGKPGKKGEEEPKADFCSLKTSDGGMIKDLFFDFPDFKEIKIKHTLEINQIELPKGVEDPREMREKAKRVGVVKRFVKVDGRGEVREKEFSA